MAYETGTATGHIDLWNKFLTFITTNADLVADGQAWTVAWEAASGAQNGIVISGPGASGSDTILVGLSRFDSPTTDGSYFDIRGMTGVLTGAADINSHINRSPIAKSFFDSNAMQYWFIANGRRFIILAKMSTVYSMMYGGFILPYANPLAYPYPLLVGGCAPNWDSSGQVTNWRSQSNYHRNFFYAEYNGESGSTAANRSPGYFLGPEGSWMNLGSTSPNSDIHVAPWGFMANDELGTSNWSLARSASSSNNRLGSDTMRAATEENVGGGYSLEPFSLIKTNGGIQTYGVIDGIFAVPGQSNAAENTVTIDGDTYLVMQNVFRTDVNQYAAMRLD